jgi:hypothetical protein
MQSPVADRVLEMVELEPNLAAYRCPESGGYYLPLANYQHWLATLEAGFEKQPASMESEGSESIMADSEGQGARLCPQTGAPMSRYKVGFGFGFTIDRSPTGGIWLDGGKWEALKGRGFNDEVHLIFTPAWQMKVRKEALAESVRASFAKRIGEDTFPRVREFKDWMKLQPKAREILSYLNEADA